VDQPWPKTNLSASYTIAPKASRTTAASRFVWPGGKQFFYWDDDASRRAVTRDPDRATALEQAKALARDRRAMIRNPGD